MLTYDAALREDCYVLSTTLPDLDPNQEHEQFQSNFAKFERSLTEIFRNLAEKRQPRTAALVKGARAQGQQRVITTGPEDCQRRDERIKVAWTDTDAVRQKYEGLLSQPFQHQSQ